MARDKSPKNIKFFIEKISFQNFSPGKKKHRPNSRSAKKMFCCKKNLLLKNHNFFAVSSGQPCEDYPGGVVVTTNLVGNPNFRGYVWYNKTAFHLVYF